MTGVVSEITRQNGDYWEAIAAHRPGETVEYLRSGGEVISPEELTVIGPVTGRRQRNWVPTSNTTWET